MRWRTSFGFMTPFLIVSLLLLGLGIGAAWYVQRLHRDSSRAVASYVTSVRAAEELEIGLREIRTYLDRFDPGDYELRVTVTDRIANAMVTRRVGFTID